MSIWIFSISLALIVIIMGLKMFELKRGRQFLVSKKLLVADEIVVPKVVTVYRFFTERGEKTLTGYISQIPLFIRKVIIKVSRMVDEKSKVLRDSSRGKYSLKNGDTPNSEFLKTMIEYKNGEKDKENGKGHTTLK
ncbi:MAG: hypothetical protein KAR00_01595 [Candidatus Pacebacteria bacterium]|nr:hypothetical protein [Candidatus Paceibacterota bacterium]